MADAAYEIRANLEKQIADLKKEMSHINKLLSSRASDAMEDAQEAFEDGKGRARHAVAQVREQANVAVGAMRDNPGTAATILSTVGLLGLAAGLVLGGIFFDRRR
ncbi:conserved hypothetical protein [uncultured Pleomorphomonas sp.]|uniref:DUF883 domain-containing protein n=2 Tax=Pleomorphomonas TaxID=261933 RepID=A0A2G9WZQ3_9HYPH|nr:hypothetical protein [Pleomorphomonas carboxyditropha]PIP00192.1 hypothetical protein CJ014_05495 [Pleomorphomonas carboxyditropha]SCM76234.1 conserved hypothetical protein [uncultured Pleomorphomonas sp.]